MWYVRDVLYAVLCVRVSSFVVRGCDYIMYKCILINSHIYIYIYIYIYICIYVNNLIQ